MGYEAIDAEIAKRILAAIEAAGVSERSVHIEAGIADATWDRIIRKGVGGLRTAQLIRIAAVLHLPITDLLPEPAVAV